MLSPTQADQSIQDPPLIRKKNSQTKPKPQLLAYRCMIAYRFILACFGGYLLASLTAVAIADLFIEHGSSAAVAATLIGLCLHVGAFIWVFMVNQTLKATLGIFIPSLMLFALTQFLGA